MSVNRLVACAVLALAPLVAAVAQTAFPDKPIRIVVPYSPGGSSDLLARALGEQMSADLGQPVVVENRAGAGSMVGTAYVATQPADGHTLLLADVPFTIVAALYAGRIKYNAQKDFVGVALLGESPMYLFATQSFQAGTVEEVLKLARDKPGQLTIGSGGNGSLTHLMAELLMLSTGVRLAHVPYKGAAAAMSDLAGGQVQLSFSSMASATSVLSSGRVRPLAVSAPVREAAHGKVPTFRELGFDRMTVQNWWGVMLPAGTPADRVAVLERSVLKTVASASFAQRLGSLGVSRPGDPGSKHFSQLLAEDFTRWQDLVNRANIRIDP